MGCNESSGHQDVILLAVKYQDKNIYHVKSKKPKKKNSECYESFQFLQKIGNMEKKTHF